MPADIEPPAAAPSVQSEHPDMVVGARGRRDHACEPAGRFELFEGRQADGNDQRVAREQTGNGDVRHCSWPPLAPNLSSIASPEASRTMDRSRAPAGNSSGTRSNP